MDVRNCYRCGKLFTFKDSPLCPECKNEDEILLKKVKKFIDNNPDCNILEIVKNTGINSKKLFSYIKNGDLEVSYDSMEDENFKKCKKCGKKISVGDICNDCLFNNMQSINKTMNNGFLKKDTLKMHTYRKNK